MTDSKLGSTDTLMQALAALSETIDARADAADATSSYTCLLYTSDAADD